MRTHAGRDPREEIDCALNGLIDGHVWDVRGQAHGSHDPMAVIRQALRSQGRIIDGQLLLHVGVERGACEDAPSTVKQLT